MDFGEWEEGNPSVFIRETCTPVPPACLPKRVTPTASKRLSAELTTRKRVGNTVDFGWHGVDYMLVFRVVR